MKKMVSSVRLEHRTFDNRVLHLISTKETKPQFVRKNNFEEETVISKEIGYRLLFSSQPSALDVIKVRFFVLKKKMPPPPPPQAQAYKRRRLNNILFDISLFLTNTLYLDRAFIDT
jgi:hypothetical protein